MERLEATIRGRVQGVGFRYFALVRAMDLDLTGWVANGADGSVICIAEGARTNLDSFLTAIEAGPPGAIVEGVSPTWSGATGSFSSFEIRSGAHRGD